MRDLVVRLGVRVHEEAAAVATEYLLVLILVALAIVAGATVLGTALAAKYGAAATCVSRLPACP